MIWLWAYLVVGLCFVARSLPVVLADLQPRPVTLLRKNKPAKHVEQYYGVTEAAAGIALPLLAWPLFAAWIVLTLSERGQQWLADRGWLP